MGLFNFICNAVAKLFFSDEKPASYSSPYNSRNTYDYESYDLSKSYDYRTHDLRDTYNYKSYHSRVIPSIQNRQYNWGTSNVVRAPQLAPAPQHKSSNKFKAIHSLPLYLSNKTCTMPEIKFDIFRMTTIWRALLHYEDFEILNSYVNYAHFNVRLNRRRGDSLKFVYTMESTKFKLNDILQLADDIIILPNEINGYRTYANTFPNQILDVMKTEENKYVGFIKEIGKTTLQFDCKNLDRFNAENRTYTVIFRPGRHTIRYQYWALDLIDKMSSALLQRFLFPSIEYSSYRREPEHLELTSKQIDSNLEQREAVEHIALCKHYEAPYIIFGPPGTGKTSTIVEGIIQLYRHQPDSRILIMAPTNSVCNEIATRLLNANPDLSLFRIFSQSALRQIDSIDKLLLNPARSNYKLPHYYPTIEHIHRHRIVVCTLSGAGKLALGDFGKGYGKEYTHIFIDEAASCTEPDILMGIASHLRQNMKLILSGDHKQLGPVITSQAAKKTLLSVSLLERLLNLDCYRVDEAGRYNRNIQIRLRNNYRSHPEIVRLYNELYYNNELRAMGKPENIELSDNLKKQVDSEFPIIFRESYDESIISEKTKSTHNMTELKIVLEYVEDLINNMNIKTKDIGIITPYKDQNELLKKQLKDNGWKDIECGSVETFQGKEKDVIIISFVRSKMNLGFLNSPQRLNVMLSRPKSLLIMIGNPKTLRQNKDFRYVINACNKNHDRVKKKNPQKYTISDIPVKKPTNKKPRQKKGKGNQASQKCIQ